MCETHSCVLMKRSHPPRKLPENFVKRVGGRESRVSKSEVYIQKDEGMLMKNMGSSWFFLLLFTTIGCSANLNSNEAFGQQEMENDSFRCEKITDARLGGRGVPDWQRAYEECMVTGGN